MIGRRGLFLGVAAVGTTLGLPAVAARISPEGPALGRINQNRLIYIIGNDVSMMMDYFKYEINDHQTRGVIQTLVSDYLEQLKTKRALRDYAAVCDESNNPPDHIDRHLKLVHVHLRINSTLNYVPLRFISGPHGVTCEVIRGFY